MTNYFVVFFDNEAEDLLRAGKLQPGHAMQANDLNFRQGFRRTGSGT
jgi:hypothetical protein